MRSPPFGSDCLKVDGSANGRASGLTVEDIVCPCRRDCPARHDSTTAGQPSDGHVLVRVASAASATPIVRSDGRFIQLDCPGHSPTHARHRPDQQIIDSGRFRFVAVVVVVVGGGGGGDISEDYVGRRGWIDFGSDPVVAVPAGAARRSGQRLLHLLGKQSGRIQVDRPGPGGSALGPPQDQAQHELRQAQSSAAVNNSFRLVQTRK